MSILPPALKFNTEIPDLQCLTLTDLQCLTLKATRASVADKILIFSEKIKLGISCELSAKQTIHMKYQALLCLKINYNNSKST